MPSPCSIVLADGRALAWYEFGDPAGVPCLYLPGTPTSGLVGEVYSDVARRTGIRLMALDKPGYGSSDYAPRRRLLDIGADVNQLAARLGIERMLVVGESGGAPHALALACAQPALVAAIAIVAGIGPVTTSDVAAMTPSTRMLIRLARRSRLGVRVAFAPTRRALVSGVALRRVQQLTRDAPAGDRRVLDSRPEVADLSVTAAAEAVRPGTRAVAQELSLFARPWGFDPSMITLPVDVWHGAEDRNVPVAIARRLAQVLPSGHIRIVEDAGHSVGLVVAEQLFTALREGSTRARRR